MHINKTIIINVATDATTAIITTTFLSSSDGFRLNGLLGPLLAAFIEGEERLFDAIVEDKEPLLVVIVEAAESLLVVTGVVFVVVLVVVMVLTDMLGVCVIGANRVIGS